MARYFNGSSNSVEIAYDSRLSLSTTWCIGGWVKVASNPTTSLRWMVQSRLDTSNYWGVISYGVSAATYPGKFLFGYRISGTNWILMASSGSPANSREWQYLQIARNGAAFKMYIDGAEVGSASNANAPSWDKEVSLFFGSSLGTSGYFDGDLAGWGKWDRILSDAENASLAAGANTARHPLSLGWDIPLREDLRERQANLTVTNSGSVLSEHPRVELPPQNGILQPVIQRALGA